MGGYRCVADRQVAKGVWIPGKVECVGRAGLLWEATGVEDPTVREKVEESLLSSKPNSSSAEIAKAFRLEVMLEDIVGHPQRSKPPTKPLMRLQVQPPNKAKSSVVLRFVTDESRDTIIDVIQPLLAQLRKGSGTPGKGGDPFASVSGTNVQAKRKLLLKNEDLGELYKQVVATGAVTDQEFWVTKRKLLEKELSSVQQTQKRGKSSAMLADVELTNDGKNFVVNFKLTDEVKKHIFAEKPKVYQSYLKNVPSKLSEKEFWTKYCRHLYYQKVSKKNKKQKLNTGGIGKSIEEAEEKELMKELFTENDGERRKRQALKEKKVTSVDPSIDLTTDHHDGFSEGYGLRHNAAGVIGDTSRLKTSSLVRDLNRHAAVVVSNAPETVGEAVELAGLAPKGKREPASSKGRDPGGSQNVRPRAQASILDDLVQARTEGFEALDVRERSLRTEAAAEGSRGSKTTEREAAMSLLRGLREVRVKMPLTTSEEEKGVLEELEKRNRLIQSRNSMLRSVANGDGPEGSDQEVFQQVRRASIAVNELLRHFWASFPLSSEHRIEKVKRINQALVAQYEKIEKMRSNLDSGTTQFARPLIGQVLAVCDKAFEKYDAAELVN
ncbi:subunit 1 of transcription initiation factor TFIIH [Chloropicon primus]|uniref:Subunit 1 of transcription initiation factor TFIIH n=3 Tax=Chloropicon primus TaxID=1764295 RepID=A0A5B8MTW4_9CHLO|nr:subunit 1 of transcription initiation factor TFIIH [Chloropicon primus]UPR02104.1 subunit 1 of transcription initiation factor TFIIH [Chloropicon primus]|eukprot:QDZ22880.1 subunit 1 of transcription initiation factor TFIIH [Chloropicon primus]